MNDINKNEKRLDVIVITNPDLGWDCVVGVYTTFENIFNEFADGDYSSQEELEGAGYVLHTETLTLDITTIL